MAGPQKYAAMPLELLFAHRDDVTRAILDRLLARLDDLDDRISRIDRRARPVSEPASRSLKRRYPKVRAKYRNPANPSETWSGRGYKPRWLTALLATGRPLDDFRATAQGVDRRRTSTSR